MVNTNLRVLLVEDSQPLSERLLEMISSIDGIATIGTVTTEADAVQYVEQYHPDAVILDLRLKEGTGFGVMRYVNTLGAQLRPELVVITNYALPQYRQQAEVLGVRYFLDKMQEFDQLPHILESLRDSTAAQSR